MRKTFICCLALLFLVLGASAVQAQTENDIFGYYTIQKPVPSAFAEISEIHLAGDYGAQQTPAVHGLIRLKPKYSVYYPLNKPILSGKKISFTTKSITGGSYKFVGEFVKFPNNQQQTGTVLRGVLQKFRGKTKIAEANVKFSYTTGD